MTFPPVRLAGRFPELHGFVLLDPARLDRAFDGAAAGADLLTRLGSTDLGDRVAAEGIAIPLFDVDPGRYTVLVRHRDASSPWPAPLLCSPGWVLGTTTGSLLLCGAGYLLRWDPDDYRHGRVEVPPGWYEVEVRGHLLDRAPDSGASDDRASDGGAGDGRTPDDGAYEFVLTPVGDRPPFRARLDRSFGLV